MQVRYIVIIFLFLSSIEAVLGQNKGTIDKRPPSNTPPTNTPTSFPPPNTGTSSGGFSDFTSQQDSSQERDTVYPFVYQYFYMPNPRKKYIEDDTTLGNFFKDVEVSKRQPYNMIQTGNNGSALLNLILDNAPYTGFHSGLHQYDYYNYKLKTLPFFDSQRTLADLYFSQIAGNQGNFEVGARYAQAYSDGTRLSINYRRISQEGYYKEQDTKTTNFATIIRFNSLNRKMKSFLGFLSNINNESHNGGIMASDSLLEQRIYRLRKNVPITLESAKTRHDFSEFFLHNEYSLTKYSPDSSGLNVGYNLSYIRGYYKFSDFATSNESSLAYYRIGEIDTRGIRNYIGQKNLSNEFFIRGSYKSFIGKAALIYDRYNISNTQNDIVNDVTVSFDGIVTLVKSFDINTTGRIGLGENVGSFYLNADGNFKVKNIMSIGAKFELYNSQVGYMDKVLYINDQSIYNNKFSNQLGNSIEGQITIPKIKLKVLVGQQLINNFIYGDTSGFAQQSADLVSVGYIGASHDLKVGNLHLENHALLQAKNKDFLPLPTRYLKSNLYYEGSLFKKVLLLRLGAEYIYIPEFNLPSYNIISGRYYLASKTESRDYQNVDLYLNAKVSKFRLFIKVENALDYFKDRINYLVVGHPQFDMNIRFGIRWLFLD